MAIIEFKNVTKTYQLKRESVRTLSSQLNHTLKRIMNPVTERTDYVKALNNVTFSIEQGESVGIIGSNGAGKSTILRLISNITKPTSGIVAISGRIAPLLEVGAGFHPELTGRENVYLNGVILGLSRREIDARFDQVVTFSELERFIDMPVKQYSSGMYMRLGFSVAVHSNFDVLLADEILAVGDQRFRSKCLNKLDDLKAKGCTLVLVSHQIDYVRKHCQTGILVEDGEIRSHDKIDRVWKVYNDLL